jgi:probable HAF family extracellular repeat protein
MTATKHSFADDAGNNAGLVFNTLAGGGYSGLLVDVGEFMLQGAAVTPFTSQTGGVTVSNYADDTNLESSISPGGASIGGFNDAGIWGDYSGNGIFNGYVLSGGTLITIDDPNGTTGSRVGDVSDNGQFVLGYYYYGSNQSTAFLYQNGKFSDLATPNLGGAFYQYVAVNNSGELVGNYSSGGRLGFTDIGGVYSTISDPTPGASDTKIIGVSDSGDIYGTYFNSDGQATGFVDSNGIFTDIVDPNAVYGTYLEGVTASGDVYGFYYDANYNTYSFIDHDAVFTTVADPNGVNGTYIDGVDSAGDILGEYYDSNYNDVVYTATETLCYLRGTRILTPNGEVPVEDLRIGDLVVTRQGGFRAVKWIGRQSCDARFVARDKARLPVRIRAGALGEGLPARDLYVSPGHSMLVDGTLLLASTLVNGVTITHECPEAMTQIDYFQPELEGHDCILAEGAWSETFADGPGLRSAYHNAAEFWALYSDYRTPDEIMLCAPRPERGAALEAALRPLVARASAGQAPGHLHGSIDRVSGREIDGWAFDAAHPHLPVLVEVVLDGTVIHTALACDFRPDLRDAGFGLGRCAFFLSLPDVLPDALLHTLQVRRAGDGAVLAMSEACRESCGLAPALLLAA